MSHYNFQSHFIFVLCVIIKAYYSISQEIKTTNGAYILSGKYATNNCCDFRKLPGGVACKNATDSVPDYLLVKNGNKLDNICELEFADIKYIPARIFQGKRLQSIVVDDPNVNVDRDVLKGIIALDEFEVQQSSIEVVPDFKIVKFSIVKVSIMSSLLTSLKGENLQNLPMTMELSFENNFIRFIDPDVFKGTENAIFLDLSRNLLAFIPPNLLNPMKNLTYFGADRNNLLHVNNLFSVTRPKFVTFRVNNLTDISSVLQLSLEDAQKLTSANVFRCDRNKYARSVEYFHSLCVIENLDLSYNSIKETSQSIFPCYRTDWAAYIVELISLNLNGNHLENLTFLVTYLRVLKLQVAENQIQYLTDEDFKLTSGTAFLELRKNNIKRIDTNTFKAIRTHLLYLDLSSNLIKSLNGSMRYLTQLQTLKLGHNSIENFVIDEFPGLDELSELNLEHNHIKTVDQLQQLPQLRYLNIRHNNIESIRPDVVPKTLIGMHLAGNPIKCNCLLQLLIRRLNASSIATDIDTCSKPDFAVGIPKKSFCPDLCSYGCTNNNNDFFTFVDCSSKNLAVGPELVGNNCKEAEITSGHWHQLAEDPEMYYSSRIEDYPLEIWGYSPVSSRYSFYPRGHSKYSTFHIRDKILGINLENNRLESLEIAQFPPNLIQLYLSNNKLRRLPDSIFEKQRNLKQVTLSRNPWKCDCDALKFKKWLTSEKEIIKDIDNVYCGISGNEVSHLNGRILWNLTDLDLCPTDRFYFIQIISASSGTLTFVIFCLVAKILYTKYELNIKVFLYSHGVTFVKEEELDYNKIFDAFVSFSHDDDEFVIKQIVSVIENKNPNIHLCLHYRHFIPGEFIYANITRAVQNSRRTVLILSRNFLESEWCILEFQTAHFQAMQDKVHRVILIKIGDLPRNIDPSIRAYLDSTTYLTWGENNFWNKLLYVLPSQSNTGNTLPRNMGSDESISNCPISNS